MTIRKTKASFNVLNKTIYLKHRRDKMDVKEEFSKNQIILFLMPNSEFIISGPEYDKIIVDIIKQICDKKICYVTFNKTYPALKEFFENKKIKVEIFYIDAVSQTFEIVPPNTKECHFVNAYDNLKGLSLIITKCLTSYDYIIFDSINSFLAYQKESYAIKFLSNLFNKIKANKIKAIFYATILDENEYVIKKICNLVDNVIDLSKNNHKE